MFLESAQADFAQDRSSCQIQSSSTTCASPKREVKGARRVRNACLQCRERKIRCSRTYPCKIISDILSSLDIPMSTFLRCAYQCDGRQVKDVSPEGMARRVIGKAAFQRELFPSPTCHLNVGSGATPLLSNLKKFSFVTPSG
jgi:hypothetical protein